MIISLYSILQLFIVVEARCWLPGSNGIFIYNVDLFTQVFGSRCIDDTFIRRSCAILGQNM